MAKIRGNGGVVKISTVTVGAVVSFTIDETMEPIDSTDLATNEKEFVAGETSWTAQVECQWDAADTTGQGAMTIGTEVELHLVRDGDADTPADNLTGQAFVAGISSANSKGSMVTQSFSLQGTGLSTK